MGTELSAIGCCRVIKRKWLRFVKRHRNTMGWYGTPTLQHVRDMTSWMYNTREGRYSSAGRKGNGLGYIRMFSNLVG